MTSDSGRGRILDVATRLFAALGYDGTSTRLIAEAAGLNIATVAYHVGGKRDLYLAVMERAHQKERAALEAALAEAFGGGSEGSSLEEAVTLDASALLRLLDRYIDFCAENPEIPALWMHRWLSDAADVAHLENLYVKPLMELVTDAVRQVVDDDVDVEYVVWSVIWCTHGFGRGGVLDENGRRRGMDDPRELARFRAHLHRLVAAALRLPPEPDRPGGPSPDAG
ncbi:TetR/AcrR family transcriptional regulator [Actinomadura rubrisoli]|uniref:TetR/AcrR family transcriptional regulator n=1 Tax=Actinomadura rubrisoli TaxID=2530368 RepID=A0A4R5B4W9_9ACTN|nr:TetR/AcrR family transcriptional regulator [Actinomadura rubrisoli]TDD80295.1 TetR/AcrR family transcriptional regulator [Actinomadura rubrisoli]